MPPSRSAVRPTKLTNWVKRSASRRSDGAGSVQSRTAKPLCGNLLSMPWRAALSACLSEPRSFGKLHAIGPANQAAGLQQPGARQRLARHQQLRPISETIGEPVGLNAEDAADGDAGLADGERAADLDAEPIEQGALDQHHAGGAPSGAGIRRLDAPRPRHRAGRRRRRPSPRPVRSCRRRRGPWRGSSPIRSTWPSASSAARSSALAWRLISSKARSPPIKQASLPRQCLLERGRQRADRRHGGDAKGDAEHEHGEAAGAGAQLAHGDRERQRQPEARSGGRGGRACRGHDAATLRLAPALTMRPSARLTMRSQRLARVRSWVMSSKRGAGACPSARTADP